MQPQINGTREIADECATALTRYRYRLQASKDNSIERKIRRMHSTDFHLDRFCLRWFFLSMDFFLFSLERVSRIEKKSFR